MEETGRTAEECREKTGTVHAVCISKARGTEKEAVPEGHFLVNFGIEGDAHGGNWHRQVSLLSYDKVEEFNSRGAGVKDGAFGKTWLWKELIFVPFLWEPDCMRATWFWR